MEQLQIICEEAKELRDRALRTAEAHFAAEGPWYTWYYALGIPTIVLASVAGAIGLGKSDLGIGNVSSSVLAGILSSIVAALTSLTTFLNPQRKADAHHKSAKAYEALYDEIGNFLKVQTAKAVSPEGLTEKLNHLASKYQMLRANSPPIPEAAARRARENIASGIGEVFRDSRDEEDERTSNQSDD